MIKVRTVLKALFMVFGTLFAIDGATKLMTLPSDLAVMAGLTLLALLGLVWANLIYLAVKNFFKENNEKL